MGTSTRKGRRGLIIGGVVAYVLLLVASHVSQRFATMPMAPPAGRQVIIPPMGRDGPVDGAPEMGIDVFEWGPSPAASERVPVIMLHGSPGHGADFAFARSPDDLTLEQIFTSDGRSVIAPNLPGFGESLQYPGEGERTSAFRARFVPSYSGRAHAHAILAMMDALGVERAHIVGWSNGGYAAIHAADIAPERVASVTMLASVGAQETEGSGSYIFEHAKYALGIAALGAAGELIPHFGLIASRSERIGWLWNFWDTDQRPAREIMGRLTTPTLILHGRHDFLTADWNAERHHELMPTSRLVMLDASHFIPFMQTEEAGEVLLDHFARHDSTGAEPLTGYDDRSPRPERAGLGRVWEWLIVTLRGVHWVVWIVVLTPMCYLAPRVMTAVLALLVAAMTLDFGVATAALWLGAAWRLARNPERRRSPACWLGGVIIIPLLSLTFVWLLSHGNIIRPEDGLLGLAFRAWGLGVVASIALGVLALALARLLLTRSGWRRLRLLPDRIRRHEFWPTWALYLAISPRLIRLARAHGGLRSFSCANPGIPNGGGIIGESKIDILDALGRVGAPILPAITIETGADSAERALQAIEQSTSVGPLPVVLKPDVGQRGADVTLARTQDDVRRFFRRQNGRAIAQKYHPGPVEIGLLWIRDPAHVASEPADARLCGRVFSITRKQRSEVVGDGRRSIARLVRSDPRLRHQRDVLLKSLDSPDRVPDHGERVNVGQIGNHALGARFSDGADLITPELERAVDDIARAYRGYNDGPLDYGRLDIRAKSEDDIRCARDLAVIELNGVTGESTNIYDPGRSRAWALGVLGDQWEALARVGNERRKSGAAPIGYLELVRTLWKARTR